MSEIDLDPDFAALVGRRAELAALRDRADAELREINAKIRSLLAPGDRGLVDGRPVIAVTPNRRFDPDAAAAGLPGELRELCMVTEFSARKAKQVLPPALYESFMKDAGEPVVRAL